MSLLDATPPPAAVVVTPDPKRWGTRYPAAQRDAHRVTVTAHRRAVEAHHPSVYDHEAESSLPMLMVFVSTLEASLIVTALRGSAFVPCRELGERLAVDLRDRADACNPHGMVRP